MEMLLIGLIWVLNFGISIWNAYACGKAWAETKAYGGWPRFMTWMGAVMSASGFTWCYLIVLALSFHFFGWLTEYHVGIALQFGYVILVPGILFSGIMITIDSWARAFRNGGVLNYGVAVWNTYAQIHNTYSAIKTFGSALGNVGEFFAGKRSGSRSKDSAIGLLVLLLVVLAVAGGILTTTAIIRRVAATDPLPSREELERRRLARKGEGAA